MKFIASTALAFLFTMSIFPQGQQTVDSDNVFLNVTVLTNKDEPVSGLERDSFSVYENKRLIPITTFAAENVPMTVGILVDRSSSTKGFEMPAIRKALKKFVNENNRNDEYFLMAFGKTQHVLLENTSDKAKITEAIDNISENAKSDETRFFDALEAGAQKASAGRFPKRILLVLSDGQDTDSKQDIGKASVASEKYGVTLYLIDLGATDPILAKLGERSTPKGMEVRAAEPRSSGRPAAVDMEFLADVSAGRVLPVITDDDLDRAFSLVSNELQNQYQIVISLPPNPSQAKKPQWRNLSIKLGSMSKKVEMQKPWIRARKRILL